MSDDERGWLGAVGVSGPEEEAYFAVVDGPGRTTGELAEVLEISESHAADLLARLARKGLVSRAVGLPLRWLPSPPDVAIEALAVKQQEGLARARLGAARLAERVRAEGNGGTRPDLLEIINDPETLALRVDQLQESAERELLSFVKGPYVRTPGRRSVDMERASMDRGVAYRVIYDAEALARLQPEAYREDSGEQARLLESLPMKLVIVDRRIAMLPAPIEPGAAVGGSMVVRASALLDALVILFETLWERATPIGLAHSEVPATPGNPEALADKLVPLLAAGLSDAAISRVLQVSPRSLDRRTKALFSSLNASTRFQAGWLAAHRAADEGRKGRKQ